MVNKNKSFKLSQNKHVELNYIHEKCIKKNIGNFDKHFIAKEYHALVFDKQKKMNKILNKNEKKKIYNYVVSCFY